MKELDRALFTVMAFFMMFALILCIIISDSHVFSSSIDEGIVTAKSMDRFEIQVSGTTYSGEKRAEWWDVGEAMYGRIRIGNLVRKANGKVWIVL